MTKRFLAAFKRLLRHSGADHHALARLARTDALTGLPNRMMLTESVEELLVRGCGLLILDLDRFKPVNDRLGHAVGDRLLELVGLRLRGIMAPGELCGRLGGDEFMVVLPDAGRVEAVARAIVARLSLPFEVDGRMLHIGASVGSAIAPRDGASVSELMHHADLALYRAKAGGGEGHCPYEAVFRADDEGLRVLELALQGALARSELALHYQPVVDARNRGLLSFEALLRWNHPELGPVDPAQFLPLAEASGAIVPIGAWILREACAQAMRWPADIRLAVNISGEQLLDPGFEAAVTAALEASGLPAWRLEIEVTEGIFLRDAKAAKAALEGVIALGCTVALDDFGTGGSSLAHLRMLRFATIKVDRAFVQGAAAGDPESRAILRAAVAMGDSLGVATVAEGVETWAQLEVAGALGCNRAQGFYCGRPMSAADAEIFARGPMLARAG